MLLTYMFKISFCENQSSSVFELAPICFCLQSLNDDVRFKFKIPYFSVLFTKYRFLCPGNVLHILFLGSMKINRVFFRDKRFVKNKKEEGILILSSPFCIQTCNTFRPALSANQNAQLVGHYQ